MGRWRQPGQKSSPYITPEGERTLRAELKELWQRRRQEVVPALSAAAAEGDRSENAEYIYRKKQLAEIAQSDETDEELKKAAWNSLRRSKRLAAKAS